MAADRESGGWRWRSTGSGTVLTADGVVLTSLHVLYDQERYEVHPHFIIAKSRGFGRDAQPLCTGRTDDGAFDEALDLALLRCDSDLEGEPMGARVWPFIQLRDGAGPGAEPGTEPETIHVLGFAEDHGGRLVWSRGSASADGRTDAIILPGMSGGAALDANGHLFGVPLAYRYRVHLSAEPTEPTNPPQATRIGRIQPIARARDWLHANLPTVSAHDSEP